MAELRRQLAESQQREAGLRQQVAGNTTPQIEQIKAGFTVPKGEEGYVHAYVTHKNGVAVPQPMVEPYHPNIYQRLKDTPGFTSFVIHQPGKHDGK